MLKKVITSIMIGSALMVAEPMVDLPFSMSVAEAADVYAGNLDGYEIYVRTETIQGGSDYVTVTTKGVSNGNWVTGETWYFSNSKGWRYQTETMKKAAARKGIGGHTTIVPSGSVVDNILRIALRY